MNKKTIESLKDYAKKMHGSGASDIELIDSLLKSGWQKETVEKIFKLRK